MLPPTPRTDRLVLPQLRAPGPPATPRGGPNLALTSPHERLPRLQGGSVSPCAPEPRLRRTGGFERKIRDMSGRTIDALRVDDLRGESARELRGNLAELKLNEYFDGKGSMRFERLGLTFAAKQHPQVQDSFGTSLNDADGHSQMPKRSAVKAYFCAIEAKEKDLELGRKKRDEVLASISAREKNRVDEVRSRQFDVLFSEIPVFLQHMPPGVDMLDMLPPEYERDEELKQRRLAEKARSELADKRWTAGKQMEWIMTRVEVLALSKVVSLWVRAGRGGNCPLGMDRPTFCRFILDLGLVDQFKVPYYWAVSLFDEAARKLRLCPPDMPMSGSNSAPIALVSNKWVLISVLDTILRQHFNESSKHFFFASLLNIAKLKLPSYIVEESGICEETLLAESRPASPDGADHTAASGFGKKSDADSGQAPGWTRDPNQLASMQDIAREEQVRDCLTRSMFVEPEVLHIVAQHQSIFTKLHRSYADERGHLDYPSMLQFCTDFHLTPTICSSHQLARAYEAARSLELAPAPPPLPPRDAPPRGTRARQPGIDSAISGQSFGLAARRMSVMPSAAGLAVRPGSPGGETDQTETGNTQSGRSKRSGGASPGLHSPRQPREALPGAGMFATSLRGENHRPNRGRQIKASANGLTAGKLDDLNRRALESEIASKELTPRQRAKRQAGFAQNDGSQFCSLPASVPEAPRWAGMLPDSLPWTQVAILAEKIATGGEELPATRPSLFGVGAFIETLCQVAFTYLGSYGNSMQQNSTGYMRVVWLIAYIRMVFCHLIDSFSRRETEPAMHPSLLDVLKTAPPEHWSSPPYIDAPLLAPTIIRAGLKIVDPARKSKQQNTFVMTFRSKFKCQQSKSQEPLGRTRSKNVLRRVASVDSVASGSVRSRAMSGDVASRRSPVRSRGGLPEGRKERSLSLESQASAGSDRGPSRELPQVHEELQAGGGGMHKPRADPTDGSGRFTDRERRRSTRRRPAETSRPSTGTSQAEPTLAEKHLGEPCIEDRYCRVCLQHAEARQWGNCRCAGCSIVDILRFEHHPLKPLLQLWPDGVAVEAAVAKRDFVRAERCDLTAPLVGHSVRLATQSPEKRAVVAPE